MKCTKTEQRLMAAMRAMDIIDCHEHLPPESERTGAPQDVFTLFSHYTRRDLYSAGMDRSPKAGAAGGAPPEYAALFDLNVPVAARWASFEPYWRRIRHGSYARAAILTAQLVYGIEEISAATCEELSERIAAENTPGIYRRMLSDRCRIVASLTQGQLEGCELPLVPVARMAPVTGFASAADIEAMTARYGVTVSGLDDYLVFLEKFMDSVVAAGAVGIKISAQHTDLPDAVAADKELRQLLAHGSRAAGRPDCRQLRNALLHTVIDLAAARRLTVAVHAGIWGDFRTIDCKHMLTLAPAHPQAEFDLYHLGMPSVRDAIVIGKNLPNVRLNLCWTHIISQVQACSGIDELLDQVPVNKVLAFGGDYNRPVEKIVGHLHMAREDFARVFGARIDRGLLDMDGALEILRLWFWDNPLALYPRLQDHLKTVQTI